MTLVTWGLAVVLGTIPLYGEEQFNSLTDSQCHVGPGSAENHAVRITTTLFYLVSALFYFVLSISVSSETSALSYSLTLSRSSNAANRDQEPAQETREKYDEDGVAKQRIATVKDGEYLAVVAASLTLLFNILPQLVRRNI